MTATDVVNAIREQNVQVAAGVIGAIADVVECAAATERERARTLADRGGVPGHRAEDSPDGAVTHLHDVARLNWLRRNTAWRSLPRQQVGGCDGDQPATGCELAARSPTRSARR